jgi:hypothetical protein
MCGNSPSHPWLDAVVFTVWVISVFGLSFLADYYYPFKIKNKWLARLFGILMLPVLGIISVIIAGFVAVLIYPSDPHNF